MKRTSDLLPGMQQNKAIKSIARIFRSILSGKKFQPMPSYWALIPVKHLQSKATKENCEPGTQNSD